jgi:hypothetical protein
MVLIALSILLTRTKIYLFRRDCLFFISILERSHHHAAFRLHGLLIMRGRGEEGKRA